MRLFGWKAGRDASRPALSRGHGYFDAAGRWPQGYEAQVRTGYAANAVAQRAVRLVAESVGGAPVDASAPDLARLIGARVAGERLPGVIAAQLLLHGNAFVQILRDAQGEAAALYPLRPERVTIELDATGWPAGYVYRVGGRTTRLAAEEVIHIRSFNPLDDHYGLGCLGAASGGRWCRGEAAGTARPCRCSPCGPATGGSRA